MKRMLNTYNIVGNYNGELAASEILHVDLLSNSWMKQNIVVPATTPTKWLAEYHDYYHPAQLSEVRMSLKSIHSEKNTGNRTASQ